VLSASLPSDYKLRHSYYTLGNAHATTMAYAFGGAYTKCIAGTDVALAPVGAGRRQTLSDVHRTGRHVRAVELPIAASWLSRGCPITLAGDDKSVYSVVLTNRLRYTAMTFQNAAQLVLRNSDKLCGSSVLLVACPDPEFCVSLKNRLPPECLTIFSYDYAVHRRVVVSMGDSARRLNTARFGAWYQRTGEFHDQAVIFLPKSRLLIAMTLTMAAAAVRAGGSVLVVGENKGGIRSSRAAIEELIGEVTYSDSARHCTIFEARRRLELPPRTHLEDWVEVSRLAVRGLPVDVVSLPGVFSHGRLDRGTQLLLDNVVVPPTACVLDVGCGSGLIGFTIKRLWPGSRVDMVDSNAHAIEACRRTAVVSSIADVTVWASDVFSDVPGKYDTVVSNPPFHSGVQTDYRVAEAFCREVPIHLKANGSVVVVANRFLPYAALLKQYVGDCRVVVEDSAYRVYQASVR
jgi:16S rRNA (guanine1207-N2)-methyltransferase